MSFDYFYGQQSDLFTFYRVPKVLFTNERFWNISADAKMLYGIAKQDFELVQRIRRLDTRTSPKQDTVYLFSGVLICGCCGSRMTRKTNRVKGKEYHYD